MCAGADRQCLVAVSRGSVFLLDNQAIAWLWQALMQARCSRKSRGSRDIWGSCWRCRRLRRVVD